jgi:hypothetical protein
LYTKETYQAFCFFEAMSPNTPNRGKYVRDKHESDVMVTISKHNMK